MTTHDDSSITRILRELDPAVREPSQAQRARATSTLERILATDPRTPTATAAPTRMSSRRPRRLLLAGGVVAAAAAVVVAPIVSGGTEAFASWSATPVELVGLERAAALGACLVLQGNEEGALALDPAAEGSALVAEARGGWKYVVFTAPGPSGRELQGSCLMPEELVADPRAGEGGFFGSLGGAEETAGPELPRDVMREDSSGVGSVGDEMFAFAEGRAGADVVGIEVTTPGGPRVEASLENGRWAVWWPVRNDSPDSPDLTEAPTYDVTLREGSATDEFRTPG